MDQLHVRDFIYMDVERLKSILAQLNRGLPEQKSTTLTESDKDTFGGEGGFLNFFKLSGDNQYLWQSQSTQSQTLHDHIYNSVESLLTQKNLIMDVPGNLSEDEIKQQIGPTSFVLLKGNCYINDYSFVQDVTAKFNSIMSYLAKVGAENEAALSGLTASQTKALMIERSKSTLLPDNMVKFMNELIETFLKGRIIIKILPFDNSPMFRFTGILKKDYLRENILDIMYKFGTAPNHPWHMFAQVSAIPSEEQQGLTIAPGGNELETLFQSIFDGFRGFERSGLTVAFPEIAITPIAIYRE